MGRRFYSIGVAVLFAAVLSGCGSDDEAASVQQRDSVRIARNAWLGSELDVALAKNVLENQMGLTVEVVDIDETSQWGEIASGNIDASLEVWPSGHAADIKQFIDGGLVEDGGPLGPVGKIGWYVPTYVVNAHPELATWEGFKDPNNIQLFQTANTAPSGRFLGVDPTYVQYDETIIKNLGLDLKVVFAGTEDALLSELATVYAANDPILFYFWTPHPGINQYELTKVSLPAYSDDCYAGSPADISCDYPVDNLLKILSRELKAEVPGAYKLLKNLKISTGDQVEMMTAVTNGATADEAVAAWLQAHEATWKAWVE